MKFDRHTIAGLIVLFINAASYNFYFYELFWGQMNKVSARCVFYLMLGFVMVYLVGDDISGVKCREHFCVNIATKVSIALNFILFSLVLENVFKHPIFYLFLLNGSILAVSLIIIISCARYGYFNK